MRRINVRARETLALHAGTRAASGRGRAEPRRPWRRSLVIAARGAWLRDRRYSLNIAIAVPPLVTVTLFDLEEPVDGAQVTE